MRTEGSPRTKAYWGSFSILQEYFLGTGSGVAQAGLWLCKRDDLKTTDPPASIPKCWDYGCCATRPATDTNFDYPGPHS